MKCLSIQFQPEKSPELDEEKTINRFKEFCNNSKLVNHMDIQRGYDNGLYVSINYTTDDVKSLWNQIRSHFFEQKDFGYILANASIVVCEGDNGWNDYLLLHHYDEKEKVDTI